MVARQTLTLFVRVQSLVSTQQKRALNALHLQDIQGFLFVGVLVYISRYLGGFG